MITAYDEVVAAGWGPAAGTVYEPLAEALVATCPIELAGSRVLDAGSGTGAAAAAVARRRATVVAVDLSPCMLRASADPPASVAVAADVVALPFPDGTFDAAFAAFLLNHLDPEPAMRELGRVLHRGGVVVASTWAAGTDPAKAAADEVLRAYGWRPPAWYQAMKSDRELTSGDPDRLAALARQAGLVDAVACVHAAELGMRDPREFAAYRLAVPHVARWWADRDSARRERVMADLSEAVTPMLAGWRPAAVFLVAWVRSQPCMSKHRGRPR